MSHTHLFFDLDHTLWDTDRNAEESLLELFEELNLRKMGVPDFDSFHETYRNHNEKLWGLYAENKVGKEVVRTHRFRQTLFDFGIDNPEMTELLSREFIVRTPRKPHLIEGATELLDRLHGNYILAIITNGFPEAQHIKMKHSGLDKYFRQVIVSEEVGVHKPDLQIFRHAMTLTGATLAENCMMIGDTFQTDVLGALNAGLTAVHFAPKNSEEVHASPVITIRKLSELVLFLPDSKQSSGKL
ncbi:MAG: hypothetical protein RLZZ630_1201 [Bacteroidota bacterium]